MYKLTKMSTIGEKAGSRVGGWNCEAIHDLNFIILNYVKCLFKI